MVVVVFLYRYKMDTVFQRRPERERDPALIQLNTPTRCYAIVKLNNLL